MAGESQQTPESVPDPSVLATDALIRAGKAERDYVDGQIAVLKERLNGIDRATKVLDESVNRTPTEMQKQAQQVRELLGTELRVLEATLAGVRETQQQRKEGVDKHFEHLDKVRGEDKREAQGLVNLALAAQKEMSSTALTAANLAIDKAEVNTGKRYDAVDHAVGEIRVAMASMMPRKESEARHSAHEAAVSMLTSRVTAIEATKQGGTEKLAGMYSATSLIVSLVVVFGILAAAGVFNK